MQKVHCFKKIQLLIIYFLCFKVFSPPNGFLFHLSLTVLILLSVNYKYLGLENGFPEFIKYNTYFTTLLKKNYIKYKIITLYYKFFNFFFKIIIFLIPT